MKVKKRELNPKIEKNEESVIKHSLDNEWQPIHEKKQQNDPNYALKSVKDNLV